MKKARRIYEPWIEKTNTLDDFSEIFKKNFSDTSDFLYLLKIPARYKFNEFLLGVYNDHLYIMENTRKGIKIDKIYYKDIEYMNKMEVLLSGQIKFIAGEKEVVITYNTVSSEIIEELVEDIRSRYIIGDIPSDFKTSEITDQENLDHIFLTLLNDFKNKGDELYHLAYQKDIPISPSEQNTLQKLFPRLFYNNFKGGLYLSNGNEILIMEKSKPLRSKQKDAYGFSISYLPIEKITSLSIKPHATYSLISELEINFSKKNSKFIFEENNKSKQVFVDYVENFIK